MITDINDILARSPVNGTAAFVTGQHGCDKEEKEISADEINTLMTRLQERQTILSDEYLRNAKAMQILLGELSRINGKSRSNCHKKSKKWMSAWLRKEFGKA